MNLKSVHELYSAVFLFSIYILSLGDFIQAQGFKKMHNL